MARATVAKIHIHQLIAFLIVSKREDHVSVWFQSHIRFAVALGEAQFVQSAASLIFGKMVTPTSVNIPSNVVSNVFFIFICFWC